MQYHPSTPLMFYLCQTTKSINRTPTLSRPISSALHSRASQIHKSRRIGECSVQLHVGLPCREFSQDRPPEVLDGAVYILRVGDELCARGEDLVGYADGGARQSVVEVDDCAIEGGDDGGVSAGLVVDEGDGCGGGCGWGGGESECAGGEEGDGRESELHVGWV